MSLNFIKANNKRVLIWRFTSVLIKIIYGQIGEQTGLFIQQTQYFTFEMDKYYKLFPDLIEKIH
jgi:hypothetical protein